uniref:Integrin alpha-2 domain-containing protein n=1 Tax=Gouania willdenowi TaxID=441366 RepID=A0A8C5EGI7_GOUWI
MERVMDRVGSTGMLTLGVLSLLCSTLSSVWTFNLYAEHPTVYRGPDGSYFGYSVDFYQAVTDSNTISVLVGAPKANTSQPGIVEAGAVYYCPWPGLPESCRQIPFDNSNNRMIKVNGTRERLEFKSHQWFGASVRTHKGKVVACAPLYHWRTVKIGGEKDPVGTCYVAVQNFSAYAEYSPCRTNDPDPEGQGFCQAGFSVDFTKEGRLVVGGPGSYYWQGQVMTAGIAEILNGYSLKAVLRQVPGEKHTRAAEDSHDDSYLGYSVAVGEFTGDTEQELIAGVPRGAQNFGYVSMSLKCMASYFGYAVAVTDLNGDGTDDVLVGAPLYMEREMESKPREVGRVYLYLQQAPLTFSSPVALTGTHIFGRFGTAIAPLGDVNQDGYNDVAVGCPFGGEDRGGRVLIFNGNKEVSTQGLRMSQELKAAVTHSGNLPGYGFTLRGGQDLDNNQYPDLIVGAFGSGEVSVYRSQAVVSVEATMTLTPKILNPDDRQCRLPQTDIMQTYGKSLIDEFLMRNANTDAQPQCLLKCLIRHKQSDLMAHLSLFVLLQKEEDEFRDKLTPIALALSYSLLCRFGLKCDFLSSQAYILLDCGDDNICIPDLQLSATVDRSELVIGNDNLVMLTIAAVNRGEGAYETELYTLIPPEADYIGVKRTDKSYSKLNCEYKMINESRMVVCDLGNPMVAGTEISVGLRFSIQRLEDAGPKISFELQIHSSNKDNSDSNLVSLNLSVIAIAQLDLRGVSHPSQVVLPFPNWEPKEKPVKEDDVGPQVTHIYELHNSGPSSIQEAELQVGWPARFRDENLLYAMEIRTDGPISCRTNTSLNPMGLQISALQDTPELLGFLRNTSSPPRRHKRSVSTPQSYSSKTLNCTNISCLRIVCVVGRLDRRQSAVVKIRSRLWAHTFLQRRNDPYVVNSTVAFTVTSLPYRIQSTTLPEHRTSMGTLVLWGTPDVSFAVPLWVIILAILLGLLVLAMLTLAMWKEHTFSLSSAQQENRDRRPYFGQ